jgi:hypothetical protein
VAGHDPHRNARDTHGDPAVQPVAADSGTAPVAHDSPALVAAVRISAPVSVAIAAVSLAVTAVSLAVVRVAVALRVPESVQLGQPEPVAVRRHAGWIGIAQCSRSPDDQLQALVRADQVRPVTRRCTTRWRAMWPSVRRHSVPTWRVRAGFPGFPGNQP